MDILFRLEMESGLTHAFYFVPVDGELPLLVSK